MLVILSIQNFFCPVMKQYSFGKKEKLKSTKTISTLFREGKSLFKYPVKLVYITLPDKSLSFPIQAAVSVSKKKFSNAVDRNRIKRLLREAYRLEKSSIIQHVIDQEMDHVALMLIYVADKELPLKSLQKSIKILLSQLQQQL